MDYVSYLKVKESEKDENWYKKVFESIVPSIPINDERRTRLDGIYAIINNDMTFLKKELDRFCRPLGAMFDPFEVNEEILAYNRIFPKLQYHLGQMMQYGGNFAVLRIGDEGNRIWNEELRDYMRKSMDERIQLRLEQSTMVTQGASPEEAEKYYASMRSYEEPENIDIANFSSSHERFYSRILKYFQYKYNLNALKKKIGRHVFISDFGICGIVKGTGDRPEPYVFNPLFFFCDKSSDEEKVEKGNYWGYQIPITIGQAIDELQGRISEEKMEEFLRRHNVKGSSISSARSKPFNQDVEVDFSKQRHVREIVNETFFSEEVGQHMDDQSRTSQRKHVIWKTHLEFKAYRRVVLYECLNEFGRQQVEILPDSFEIPKGATKKTKKNRYTGSESTSYEWIDEQGYPCTAEYMFIPRRYEILVYGSDTFAVMRECPNQPISIDDPYNFELSAKGKYFTSTNAHPISIVERAFPVFLQYVWVKELQNRELRKYEGVIKAIDASMIPDYLNTDENGEPLFDGVDKMALWRYYRKKLGDSYFDSKQNTSGLSPAGTQAKPVQVETIDSIGQIINMQNLLDLLDREMSIQMLVPPQAEGSFQPYSNASDNQMAVKAGAIMAESYYAEINDITRSMLKEYLSQFKNYYTRFFEDNPDVQDTVLSYVAPDGTKDLLKVTPDMLEHEDIGVFLEETFYARAYRDIMSQRLQDIAQNQGQGVEVVSELVMSLVRGDAPEEVHSRIQKASRIQQERMERMQQMQQQMEQDSAMKQRQMEKEDKYEDHDLEKDKITHEYREKKELASIGVWLGAMKDEQNPDDDIPGPIETLREMKKMNREDERLELEKKRFEHQKEIDKEKADNEKEKIKNVRKSES